MGKVKKMEVLKRSVTLFRHQEEDFISLTDIAKHRDSERGDYIIQNWMRNRNTVEFLGIWEQLNNPSFNSIEFDGIRMEQHERLSRLNRIAIEQMELLSDSRRIKRLENGAGE